MNVVVSSKHRQAVEPELTQGHSAAGSFMLIKNSSDAIGSRNCDLWACSTVPQTTPPSRAPVLLEPILLTCHFQFSLVVWFCVIYIFLITRQLIHDPVAVPLRPWYRLPVISFSYFKGQLYLKSNYLIMCGCLLQYQSKIHTNTCLILGFRHSANEVLALRGCYARRWVVIYSRFGTTCRPHLQRPSRKIIMLFTAVSGQPIRLIFKGQAVKE